MTEKRFTLTNPKNAFQEMKCGIDDRGNTLTFNEVVDRLNRFHDLSINDLKQIEQLKHRLAISEKANFVTALEKENEELKKQMQRLYNYFVDWHGEIMGANQFSEMWDDVKEDEDWDN